MWLVRWLYKKLDWQRRLQARKTCKKVNSTGYLYLNGAITAAILATCYKYNVHDQFLYFWQMNFKPVRIQGKTWTRLIFGANLFFNLFSKISVVVLQIRRIFSFALHIELHLNILFMNKYLPLSRLSTYNAVKCRHWFKGKKINPEK